MITLSIKKTEPNPDYKRQLKEYKEDSRYVGRMMDTPNLNIVKSILEVEITEEQFEAIRKATITNF